MLILTASAGTTLLRAASSLILKEDIVRMFVRVMPSSVKPRLLYNFSFPPIAASSGTGIAKTGYSNTAS